jgi:hypothetical protein
VSLRLVFERLEHVGDVATAIGLTVGTVEGCQASYPADNRVTRPERESFDGQIVALPAVDVWGWWTVQAQWGAARETRKVLVSSSTRLDPPSIHPHVGDLVVVEALRYEDGWHAEKVTVRAGEKRVQLVGRIVDLDRSVSGASRPGWLRISSYADRLWIVSDTYVDGRLSVGAQAVVVGSVGADGSVTAVSVKIVTPSVAEPVTVRGTVQSARMAPESGATMQQWVLDKYYVLADAANPATRLEDPRGRLPVSGERFEVRGLLTENVITASVITDLGQRKVMRVDGTAVSVPPGSTIGAWTVRSAEGVETSFTVETSAVVDVRSAPAVPGVRVRAVLEEAAPGRWVALSVQTDWPGP